MRLQDIHLNQKQLWQDYQSQFSTDIEAAHKLIYDKTTGVDNRDVALKAEHLNEITDLTTTEQKWWFNDVIDVLANYKETFNNNVVRLYNDRYPEQLQWNSTTAYPINSVVGTDDDIYLAIQDVPSGTAITNISYWQLIPRGEKGYSTYGVKWRGEWGLFTSYKKYDLVYVDNIDNIQLFVANEDNGDITSPIDNTSWTLALTLYHDRVVYETSDSIITNKHITFKENENQPSGLSDGETIATLTETKQGATTEFDVITDVDCVVVDPTNLRSVDSTNMYTAISQMLEYYNLTS